MWLDKAKQECGLTALETRRLRGDQIEVFKILNGYENIDRNILLMLPILHSFLASSSIHPLTTHALVYDYEFA